MNCWTRILGRSREQREVGRKPCAVSRERGTRFIHRSRFTIYHSQFVFVWLGQGEQHRLEFGPFCAADIVAEG